MLPDKLRILTRMIGEDPVAAFYHVRARLSRDALWRRHFDKSENCGLDDLRMVLSFDCDTEEDIKVAWDVHARLMDMGMRPVYAVPGALLREGEGTYRRIAETGAEFINHGGVSHTFFDETAGRHASCFFYDQLAPERVRQDVIEGDRILRETLGIAPEGFRTPHFGTYQRPAQLRFLHGVLRELGYRFSSSTTSYWGLRKGPMFSDFGVVELPVTGVPSQPLNILDTWAYFEAPDRVFEPADYRREAVALADLFKKPAAGVINIYADPSHIHDSEAFFEAMRTLVAVAPSVHFADIVERTNAT